MKMNSATPETDPPSVLMEIPTPINFAESTAADFGISPQSFIPPPLPSSEKGKEKSRLAQLKARRRSNIGVRGSPETNSLIRFMAQQRMKTPPAPSPLQLVKSSPFLPGVASSLRQKMASFQSLMGAEESEDGSSGGCITTRDDLSDGGNAEAGKENHPPSMALPPNKKRRLAPSQGCADQIREDTPLHFSLELEEEEQPLNHKPAQSRKTEAASPALVSPAVTEEEQPLSHPQSWSPTEDQQEVVFDLQRIQELALDDPTAASPAQPSAHVRSPSISSLLEMRPTDSLSSPAVKKKKQVRFGEPLPPELFDKTLPPSTPLRKGGTPARAPTPGGALRSLLKTPQTPSAQQPGISPAFFGASPTLSMPRSRRMATTEDDEQRSEKIPFPLDDLEIESAFEESILNVQPLNLNTAFNEESLSHIDQDCETKAAESQSLMDSVSPEPLQEEEQPQTEAEAQACGSERRSRGKVTSDTTQAPARSGSRKRKLPEESEPAKRSSRAAAKTASGKMKACTAGRQWAKKVDRSLYGSREYASRNPSLSPIRERASLRLSFETEKPLKEDSPAAGPDPQPDPRCNSVSDDPPTHAAAQAGGATTPLASLSSPPGAKHSGARRTRRLSGSKVAGRALKGKKVSVNDETADKDDVALNNATQGETLKESVFENSGGAACGSSVSLLESQKDSHLGLESQNTIFSTSEKAKEALERDEARQDSPADDNTNHEIERKDGKLVQNQLENPSPSQKEEEPTVAQQPSLQPWQDEFNLEDVFKPVATRGQRSVRRSLRRKSGVDPGCGDAGSAWLPHTSPETIREARRRTRGRRLSAALLAPPEEETQD